MQPFIIEARINEWASRERNPNVPWTVDEIIADALACHEAGAAVIHFHQRDAQGGADYDYARLTEIIRGIRSRCDALVNPSLGVSWNAREASDRLVNVLRLADDGLAPDFVPLDMQSLDMDQIDERGGFATTEQLYVNSVRMLADMAAELRARNIMPQSVINHLPGLRRTLAFVQNGYLPTPLNIQFVTTGPAILAGHPATADGIAAFLPFLPKGVDIVWSAITFGVDIVPLVGSIAQWGGHVALGLGDYHHAERSAPTNRELIHIAAEIAGANGRSIATPTEARQMLGIAAAA